MIKGMTREEAIELARRACKETWNEKICKQIRKALEPKTGHWKKMVSVYDMIEGKYRMFPYTHEDEKINNPPFYVCDCGNISKKPTNYCSDCGAKMVEPQESEG